MKACEACNKPFKGRRDTSRFCSHQCSNSYRWKHEPPKTRKQYFCKTCNAPTNYGWWYCSEHHKDGPKYDFMKEDEIKLARRARHTYIRTRARAAMSTFPQICSRCPYDKHVQVCHIKAVATFPLTTPVEVINAPDNLMLLCPNCHWELDSGVWSP